ncbi:hypothetical protein [Boudabousia marimammalium]|nr:hypothetical protein [Boudabousia marimammalium]
MKKFFVSLFLSLFATVLALVTINVVRDLGLRREIWHDVTSSAN